MRGRAVLAAVLTSAVVAVAYGCAGETKDRPSPSAVTPTSDAGDAGSPAPPLESACGDVSGLLAGAPWPVRGGCPKRESRAVDHVGPSDAVIAWTSPYGGSGSSPALGAGAVWFGTSTGDVVALSPSGALLGIAATGGPVGSSPALAASGTAVVVGGDGALWGFAIEAAPLDAGADAGDAGADAGDDAGAPPPALRTVFRLPGIGGSSSPVIGGDGTIYVGGDGALVAVASDGTAEKWRVPTDDHSSSSPAIGEDGTIYVGSSAGKLYAVSPAGAVVWSFDAGSEITGSPSVGTNGVVYVGSRDGVLHAVASDGTERWRASAKGAITTTPAVGVGVVYVGAEDGALHAFATGDAKEVFTFAAQGAVGSPLVTADGHVHVGAADGRLYVVSSSGLLVFAVGLKAAAGGALALRDDGVLLVPTTKGVVAVGP